MTTSMKRAARMLLAVLAIAAPCAGASAGSNLPGEGYPAPACGEKPQVPERPETFDTEAAVADYNAKVEIYNTTMERFVTCMKQYVANAAEDLRRIRALAREAVEQANQ